MPEEKENVNELERDGLYGYGVLVVSQRSAYHPRNTESL